MTNTLRKSLLRFMLLCALFSGGFTARSSEIIAALKNQLAETAKTDYQRQIRLFNDLGWEYAYLDTDTALFFVQQGIRIGQNDPQNLAPQLANSYGTLGIIYDIKGQNNIALGHYLKSLELKEQLNDLSGMASAKSNIGALFYSQEDYGKGLVYFKEALKIEQEIQDTLGQIGSLINIAVTQKNQGSLQLAKKTLQYALTLSQKIQNKYYMGIIYNNLGAQFMQEELLDSARYYFENGFQFHNDIGQSVNTAVALDNLADIYLMQGEIDLALSASKKALNLAQQLNNYNVIIDASETRYELFMLLGELDSAFEYKSVFMGMKDSLLAKENKQIVGEIEAEYKVAEKQKQLFTKDLEINAAKKEKTLFRIIAIVAGLLVFLLAFLAFNKIRTNRLLAEKNETIQHALADKEMLMREIHHRVKNNIQAIKSIINIQRRKTSFEPTKESLTETINRVNAMALIHDKLYQQNGLRDLSSGVYLEELSHDVFKSFGINENNTEIELNLVEHFFKTDDLLTLGLIFNELITNSCKYGNSGSDKRFISIRSTITESLFTLVISNISSGEEVSTENGFGTELIQALVHKLKGKITYQAGTIFKATLEIPTQ